jgi:hypothetical protein
MRALLSVFFFILNAAILTTAVAAAKPDGRQPMTVAQLDEKLATARGQSDADLAQVLSNFELSERLDNSRLTRFAGTLLGEKSREALILLADKSAFLAPPPAEMPADPPPDAAATRQMLVAIVNYVNTTLRQLPNLIASRQTTGFEDRPEENRIEATGIVSYSALPLHFVGKSLASVAFRDRKESIDKGSSKDTQGKIGGLITTGEFGPILSTVLSDALKGRITWARWEQNASGKVAVFHYAVPEDKSNYRVQFCCVVNSYRANGQPEMEIFNERASYQGEITFNPADGSILRMTLQAELPRTGLVASAGIVIDYGSVGIGGRNYICPEHSVSVLAAHIAKPEGMYSKAMYQGPAKIFLNDIVFGEYRRFGSEARILTGEDAQPAPQ